MKKILVKVTDLHKIKKLFFLEKIIFKVSKFGLKIRVKNLA